MAATTGFSDDREKASSGREALRGAGDEMKRPKKGSAATTALPPNPRMVPFFSVIGRDHQIHQNAGNADIEPQGHGPTGDFAVLLHLHVQPPGKGEKGQ